MTARPPEALHWPQDTVSSCAVCSSTSRVSLFFHSHSGGESGSFGTNLKKMFNPFKKYLDVIVMLSVVSC